MFNYLFKKIFGTSNDRIVKSIYNIVAEINALEAEIEKLSDDSLRAKTDYFRKLLADGLSLDAILPEAFACVREAAKRVLKMRHFDVQLVGGVLLHRGMIAEMRTGEGKTLVATLAIYLNALAGKGVHLVTINDYLAQRDATELRKLYEFLGLSIGCIYGNQDEDERKQAYDADITYGTNNEFGFDYLRDNLKYDADHLVQREFNYAIVDEVDSILIDEARTPLIISGPAEDSSENYIKINAVVAKFDNDDCDVDEKGKTVVLTEKGNETVERVLKSKGIITAESGLYDYENMSIVHHINQAMKAHKLFAKDVDYIVKDGKIYIIDEFTGRIMDGRRYSEGLHQAIEAKEGVQVHNENQTLASITFQNYFRMYPKLAGMTGTAMTEADEFSDIYKLEVVTVPTNMPVMRLDEEDEVYISAKEKYNAILMEIKAANERGQPILVGTTSIEKSEYISTLLKKDKIKHNVLNARYHEKEADIIAQAGRLHGVTIATNMAGRGTDIMLGGNPSIMLKEKLAELKAPAESKVKALYDEVKESIGNDKKKIIELGGLLVIGTERHESRRIDNQLRGRSGRQGDPGRTKFYLSMEDDLMRLFGSDKIRTLLEKLGSKEGEVIAHPWLSRSILKSQQKVESRNYDVRKSLLRFDDVMNDQRKAIYEQRRFLMNSTELRSEFMDTLKEVLNDMVLSHVPESSMAEQWDLESLTKELFRIFNIHYEVKSFVERSDEITEEMLFDHLHKLVLETYGQKEDKYGAELMLRAMRQVMMITLDQLWKDHLHLLDHLRAGIGLRAYAQKDPLNEYKIEAFSMFKAMLLEVDLLITQRMFHLEINSGIEPLENKHNQLRREIKPSANSSLDDMAEEQGIMKVRSVRNTVTAEDRNPNDPSTWGKIARNENCPCGSGKKYKYCHGVI